MFEVPQSEFTPPACNASAKKRNCTMIAAGKMIHRVGERIVVAAKRKSHEIFLCAHISTK